MKNFILCLALILTASSPFAAAEEEPKVDHLDGIKWSIGFGLLRNGYQETFGFVTPTLFKVGKENLGAISLFTDLNSIILPDSYLDTLGNLEDTYSDDVALGLRESYRLSQIVQSYVKVGADWINWDTKIARSDGKTSSFGMLIAFGADFTMGERTAFGAHNDSVYVELALKYGHGRTDRLTGSPALFNGAAVNFGYRMHY